MSKLSENSNRDSLLTLAELLDAVHGTLVHAAPGDTPFRIASVCTDSRNAAPGALFVPLIGERQDGHAYIPAAIKAGAAAAFVSRADGDIGALARANPGVAFILVKNTLTALQNAAARYVAKFPRLIKCAVTGSSGKTTTKEIAVSILRQKFNVVSNVGNLNSETGLPLSVFNIRAEHELGFFEMGMNRTDEIGEIAAVLRPNYGIVTNIGTAHIGLLGSRQNIATEKKKIFNYVDGSGACVIPATDDFADFLADGVRGRIVRYGLGQDPAVEFVRDDGLDGTVFRVDGVEMRLALPGRYNFVNALGAIALARVLGVTAAEVKAGIESLAPLGGRSTIRRGRYTILEDCYNANPDSMEKALDFVAALSLDCKKILVLGDMFELGAESEAAHKEAGVRAAGAGASALVFMGKAMRAGYDEAVRALGADSAVQCNYIEENDADAVSRAAALVNAAAAPGDFVLLKGSRGMGLERLLPLLEAGQGR